MDGFHWYLSYMKFGMGRCSREAQQDIRRHHLTREEGFRLVKLYDHEFPRKHFDWMLKYLHFLEKYFWFVMDHWREQSDVWVKKNGEWVMNFLLSKYFCYFSLIKVNDNIIINKCIM